MDVLNDTPRLLSSILGLTCLTSFAFFVSACVTASTANAGFSTLLTSFLYVAFCVGGLHTVTRSPTAVSVGFLIGVSTMLCIMSLQEAIFWGQLAGCDATLLGADISKNVIAQYTCSAKSAYRSVCAFAVFNFLLTGAFTGALVRGKDDVLGDGGGGYDDVGPTGAQGFAQQQYDKPPPSTADL